MNLGLRKRAKVTGSTLNTALDPNTVKKQALHYDRVVNGKATTDTIPQNVKCAM